MPPRKPHQANPLLARQPWAAYLVLATLPLVVYAQVYNYPFVNLDDDRYIVDNPHVKEGITLDSVAWALTTDDLSNWHPLTWLSYMFDYRVFGMHAGGYHLVNVLLHVLNTLLLFHVLRRMTGRIDLSACEPMQPGMSLPPEVTDRAHGTQVTAGGPVTSGGSDIPVVPQALSAVAAALFAVHPAHVESVAWIAERKDVLSTLFWMVAVLCYVRYVAHPSVGRYTWIVLAFVCALMAKPMVVTLPCVLLLLDYWPLNRRDTTPLRKLVIEKIPLFMLSAISCGITLYAQRGAVNVTSLEAIPMRVRIANALLAYVRYIGTMVWPMDLAVFYPHPRDTIAAWQVLGSVVVLLSITVVVIWGVRRAPYLAVGWFWFLGTLVPVIGIVQVGLQAMADRYSYVPMIGLFVMLVWGCADLAAAWRVPRVAMRTIAAGVIIALAILAAIQVRYWRDSTVLFERALAVTTDNSLAHYNLGVTLLHQGRHDEALQHFAEAMRIDPDDVNAHINFGTTLVAQGKYREAVPHFRDAIRVKPDDAHAHYNLGTTLFALGQFEEAVGEFETSIRFEPDRAEAYYNLGTSLYRLGRLAEASARFEEALRLNADYLDARVNLGNVLTKLDKPGEAVTQYREVLRRAPARVDAQINLGYALTQEGKLDEAASAFSRALELDPANATVRANLQSIQDERARRRGRE